MRILIAECKQEVSSFNPALTGIADFDITRGDAVVAWHTGKRSEIGGALEVFAAAGAEVVGAYSARAITSGGHLTAGGWNQLRSEFLAAIEQAWTTRGPFDAIYFSVHGAMAAETELDPEGALIEGTRALVGDAVPLVLSMDLHGIATDRMIRLSNAIAAYHTYPHNDFHETGTRAAKALLRIVRDGVKPVTTLVRIPALVRGDELITDRGYIARMIRRCIELEQDPRVIAANFFWGNPFTDVPQLTSYALIVTDNDPELGRREAIAMSQEFWDGRALMQSPLVSIEEAVRQATAAVGQGTVVLIDAADATSSGASGDSNAVLRGLIEGGYPGKALFPIVDAPAVAQAIAAGIGATVTVDLGGTLDPARFPKLRVTGTVRVIHDGEVDAESHPGVIWHAGPTVVLQVGKHAICVTTRAIHLYDRSLFYATGQDPRRFDCVIQKSPHCQDRFFRVWVKELIGVDAPGSTSANLPYLGHTVCPRPMYPMEKDATFTPNAQLFSR